MAVKDQIPNRLPAEWERQTSTWLVWPHNVFNWGSNLSRIREFYLEFISHILKFQEVDLLISSEQISIWEPTLLQLSKKRQIRFHSIPTNTIWIRDFGPFFRSNGTTFTTNFDSWGRKFEPWNLDATVASQITKDFHNSHSKSVFEGGSLEVNGQGIGLTTSSCIEDFIRNNPYHIRQLKEDLKVELGIHTLVVLPEGLAGDHTDGHIDNFARFINSNTLLLVMPTDEKDPNYHSMRLNQEILQKHLPKVRIIAIPSVAPQYFEGEIIPHSYANFIFVNGAIIYPSYHDPKSEAAFVDILHRECPHLEIIGINAELLIEQGGSLHCMTKNQ